MSDEHFRESDLIRQRRENFQALQSARHRSLSTPVRAHPHGRAAGRGPRREDRRGARSGAAARRGPPAGSWRSAASARPTSSSSPTGRRGSRSTSARTRCRERDFSIFKLLDFGDFVGVEGRVFRTKTNELTIWASLARVPGQVLPAAAREMAWADRRRDALPPAVSRPDRQSRLAQGVRRQKQSARRDSHAF